MSISLALAHHTVVLARCNLWPVLIGGLQSCQLLSVVKAGYSRKCMFLRPTLHPSIFLVVGCNGAILVSQVPMMTLLVVYTDE